LIFTTVEIDFYHHASFTSRGNFNFSITLTFYRPGK